MCLLLAGLVLACLWPVGGLGFINYDDSIYFFQNRFVLSGLNYQNIVWAFTTGTASNWHPVTWLSLMLDCQLFGANPAGPHWVNLGLHTANTLLLFLLLRQMTGAAWRSLLVAAWFGCHPLHLESVAWVAERKDVLSGFFGLLTLLAYVRHCRRPSAVLYAAMLVCFALGLMAKPMLVSLPIVMLLFDYWPLARVPDASPEAKGLEARGKDLIRRWRPLFLEKIPLILLCAVSCLVTVSVQSAGGSVVSLEHIDWPVRCLHAAASYPLYLAKLFWPVNLTIFYPYTSYSENTLMALTPAPVVLSALCLWRARSQPYLCVGWFWFLITLVPVIGLVQVGMQMIADRYSYLPSIGIFIMVAWGLGDLAARSKTGRYALTSLAVGSVLACGLVTRHQLGYWRDTVSLFEHAVAVNPEKNFWGRYILGNAYWDAGRLAEAAASYEAALEVAPESWKTRSALGRVLVQQGKYAEAEFQFGQMLSQHPDAAFGVPEHMFFGLALAGQEKDAEAQEEFQAAQQLQPDDASIQKILAANTQKLGAQMALTDLGGQLKTNETPGIHVQMAAAQTVLGHYREAIDHYQKALTLAPDTVEALNNFAWLLATCSDAGVRDGKRAVELAQHACQLTGEKKTVVLGTLAAAYAEAGRFDEAIATAQKACASATAKGETELLAVNQKLLAQYQQHQPYHEAAEKLVPGAP